MVRSFNLDDTDERADLNNPVNQKIHQAAERMLIEYPGEIFLNLDRSMHPLFEGPAMDLVERAIAMLSRSVGEALDDMLLRRIEAGITHGYLPSGLSGVNAKAHCGDAKISVFITMQHVTGAAGCFEVEMPVEW